MAPLQIYDSRERALVRLADMALRPLAWRRPARTAPIRRILLLRLERIGDLLMTLDAIGDVRAAWPAAHIALAVGAWNAPLARLIPAVDRIHTVTVPWLARHEGADAWTGLVRRARGWAADAYDLVLNFEPDIRSNGLAWLSGAPRRFGYASGGGGAFLTDTRDYRPDRHVAENARALVAAAAAGAVPDTGPVGAGRLVVPAGAIEETRQRLGLDGVTGPLVGVHANGGRPSKQWHVDRFAQVARALAGLEDATIVLTGSAADRPLIDSLRPLLGDTRVIDGSGGDLVQTAALLAGLDLLVTGDTGPMHLADAVGTPVVALFGPSDPARYGPRGPQARVLRVSLPCSPCGQVRLPPVRCRGRVPECLDGITTEAVVAAARAILRAAGRRSGRP